MVGAVGVSAPNDRSGCVCMACICLDPASSVLPTGAGVINYWLAHLPCASTCMLSHPTRSTATTRQNILPGRTWDIQVVATRWYIRVGRRIVPVGRILQPDARVGESAKVDVTPALSRDSNASNIGPSCWRYRSQYLCQASLGLVLQRCGA